MGSDRRVNDNDTELVSAYLDDALTQPERAAFEARLQGEPELRRELREIRQTKELVQALPTVRAPRDFTVTREMVRVRQPRILIFPATTAVSVMSAVAAMLLVIAGIVLLALDPPPPQVASDPANVALAPTQAATTIQTDDRTAGESPTTLLPTETEVLILEFAADAEDTDAETNAAVVTEAVPGPMTVTPLPEREAASDNLGNQLLPSPQRPESQRFGPMEGGGAGGVGAGGDTDETQQGGAPGGAFAQDEGLLDMAAPDAPAPAPTNGQIELFAAPADDAAPMESLAASSGLAEEAAPEQAEPAAEAAAQLAQEPSPLPEPSATPTDEPTATLTPTATLAPTLTPTATATATPTPAPVLNLSENTVNVLGIVLIIAGLAAFALAFLILLIRRRA